MKYKTLILCVASIALIGIGVFLVLISVNPTNTSGPNAKREYLPTSGISKEPAVKSESTMERHTLIFPNAKRENI